MLWKHSACKGQSLHNVPPFLMKETGQDDVAWCCTYEKLKVLVLQVIANLEDFFESQRSWNNPWSFLLDFDTILYANLEDFFFSLEDGKKSMELGLDTRTYLPPPDMSIHRMWKVEKINGKRLDHHHHFRTELQDRVLMSVIIPPFFLSCNTRPDSPVFNKSFQFSSQYLYVPLMAKKKERKKANKNAQKRTRTHKNMQEHIQSYLDVVPVTTCSFSLTQSVHDAAVPCASSAAVLFAALLTSSALSPSATATATNPGSSSSSKTNALLPSIIAILPLLTLRHRTSNKQTEKKKKKQQQQNWPKIDENLLADYHQKRLHQDFVEVLCRNLCRCDDRSRNCAGIQENGKKNEKREKKEQELVPLSRGFFPLAYVSGLEQAPA